MSAVTTSAPLDESAEALTPREAMAALRISRDTLYNLIRTGQLRSFTIGRARRIPAAEIPAFIRRRMEENH